jgi:hypothetical protein
MSETEDTPRPEPFPLVTFEVPWAWRSTLKWGGACIYEPFIGHVGGESYTDFYVGLGDKGTPGTEMMDAMPGYGAAISVLAGYPLRARSRFRPWVLPSDKGPSFAVLEEELKWCKLANVAPDQIFVGRDLRLHVRPFIANLVGIHYLPRRVAGLGLEGVEVFPAPTDWTPVSPRRKANVVS